MRFNKLLDLTANGKCLSEKEVKQLAQKLKLVYSPFDLVIRCIISLALIIITIIIFAKIDNPVFGLISLGVSIVLIILIFFYKNNKSKIIKYLETLKEFYLKRLANYEGFETMQVAHNFQKNGFLQNKICIIVTDGYEFYIFDDMLKETEYPLPKVFRTPKNKYPVLKVLDPDFINKRPVSFMLSDIAFYQLNKPFNESMSEEESVAYDYQRYTYTIKSLELDNYCWLELNDRSVFKLAAEAVVLLRKKAKGKEKI